jgi:hypothetical protein
MDELLFQEQLADEVAVQRGNIATRPLGEVPGLSDILLDVYGRIRDVRIEGKRLYFITNNTDGRGNPKTGDDNLFRVPLSALAG